MNTCLFGYLAIPASRALACAVSNSFVRGARIRRSTPPMRPLWGGLGSACNWPGRGFKSGPVSICATAKPTLIHHRACTSSPRCPYEALCRWGQPRAGVTRCASL